MKIFVAQTSPGTPAKAGRLAVVGVGGVGSGFSSETTVRYWTDTAGTTVQHRHVVSLPSERRDPEPARGVMDWLASDASRAFEGRWVAIDRNGQVLAHGDSPGQLSSDTVSEDGVTIFFVLPRGVRVTG
jgi:hypothetical protein